MRRPKNYASSVAARARAGRARLRPGVTIGDAARFGPGVRCVAGPGGRVVIGARVEVGAGTTLQAAPGATVRIGDDAFISGGCIVAAVGSVTIGEGCMLAELVSLRDHDHDPAFPPRSGRTLQGDVVVGARVWVGAKATIGRGVTVGEDAVVGAHAYVNRDVEAATLVGGVPARALRSYT